VSPKIKRENEALSRECARPSSKCHHEAAAVEAEARRGREYEQAHKPEAEAKEREMQRRAAGELTPEEQKDKEAKEKEVNAEVEAIREGERLKAEGK
jgi:hypothetical protein